MFLILMVWFRILIFCVVVEGCGGVIFGVMEFNGYILRRENEICKS